MPRRKPGNAMGFISLGLAVAVALLVGCVLLAGGRL